MFGCGMGHVPAKSRRFLYFFSRTLPMIPIGFSLQPDEEFMALLGGVLRESVDYYEVAPETLWRVEESGALGPNGFHRRFAALGRENDKPFVAHGVGFSVGCSGHAEASRRKRWLDRLTIDQRTFAFAGTRITWERHRWAVWP